MSFDELYDGWSITCDYCGHFYRFKARLLDEAHRRDYISFDEHGKPRDHVIKGKNMLARLAIRDGWASYQSAKGTGDSHLVTCHLCPYCQSLNDYGEVFDE